MRNHMNENKSMITRIAIASIFLAACSGSVIATEYHVAKNGNDTNDGSASSPFLTIQHAAGLAQPGDVITVHEGVYRERINPPSGGASDDKRIVYQAAEGEKVLIKGSEVVQGWEKVQGGTWKATLPNTFFGAFNPYRDLIAGDWFRDQGRAHHTGAVYLNGHWLTEAAQLEHVLMPRGEAGAQYMPGGGGGVLLNVAWLRPGKGERVDASRYAAQKGVKKAACAEGGECIGWLEHGDWVRYEQVDFGKDCSEIEIRVASASRGGVVEFHLDAPDGELLGARTVPNTGGWQSWVSFQAKIKPTSGTHTLCLVFRDANIQLAEEPRLWFSQVDESNTTIWAQFGEVNPNQEQVEINARQTVFYPEKPGVNYITVRGFTLEHAATNWAPPTAEQVGLIGTHWSKGWVIEDNTIRYSVCTGVTLGKHGDEFDNTSANSAEGYVKTIERALAHGWSKENIGHHVVRNNHISHCEQAGIVGSMGCVFSEITDNTIHDIHVRRLFAGAEMAGIKFHGAVDTLIARNHIYRTTRGIWLDWMTQGTRVSRNLLHDNGPREDLFVEVNHGPFLVDNNILLSGTGILVNSQGAAYAHNLIAGKIRVNVNEKRKTPHLKEHSTEVAGLAPNLSGDERYYNNLFVNGGLAAYDPAKLPVFMAGNVFLNGAKPSKHEPNPLTLPDIGPEIALVEKGDGMHLEINFDKAWTGRKCELVTTELLGKAKTPDLSYENPDGSPLAIDMDYFGNPRDKDNPCAGPFEKPGTGELILKVW